jgi:hypothetical protein
MKNLKQSPRLAATRNPLRSVSLQIRGYQVTVKVKSPVPQIKPPVVRWTLR